MKRKRAIGRKAFAKITEVDKPGISGRVARMRELLELCKREDEIERDAREARLDRLRAAVDRPSE